MNYQASWQEKAKKLPEEIFSRLDTRQKTDNQVISHRALLVGQGTNFFLPDLNKFLPPSGWKLFMSNSEEPPGSLIASQDNLIYLKGQPTTHLASFPTGTFDLIISLWDLSLQANSSASYLSNIHRLLKSKGQYSIVTYLDGSPELPLGIIKRIIHQKKLPLKIFKSALPDSTGNFRKMLNKTGFGDIRIWKDNIACTYQSAEDLYNDIFSDGEGNLFMDNTSTEQRLIIKEEFINETNKSSFPLEISYDFAGGVGVKP